MTTAQNRYEINGFIDTNKSVLDNLEALGSACNTWITFDHNIGKWSIVINKAGPSVYSFNDDNIIGGIDVTETSFDEMYNSVEIQFPHEDLLDQTDWVRFDIPTNQRLPGEPLNRLIIQTTLTNDPVQAEQIAATELKQSRVNKIITFDTDYSTLVLKAGDVVDVTNEDYSFSNKLFRIISVQETDNDEGNIVIRYTCLEYDSDVYDYSNLSRFNRSRAQLTPKTINTEINKQDDIATGSDLNRLLALAGLTSLFDLGNIFDALTGQNSVSLSPGTCLGLPTHGVSGSNSVCNQNSVSVNYTATPKSIGGCPVPILDEETVASYLISGVNAADISIPLSGSFTGGSLNFNTNASAAGKTANIVFRNSSGTTLATRNVVINSGYTVGVTKLDNGSSLTYNITSNAPAGTALSWAISGSNLSNIYTGPNTGTATTDANGSASVTINITTNATSNTSTLLFTVSGGACGSASANHSEPGTVAPPPDPGDPNLEVCTLTTIPIAYCPVYDGSTLIGINVKATAKVYQAVSGGVAVPSSVGVSGGAIVVNSTINVEPTGIGAPGIDIEVITSFDPPLGPSDPLITGTLTTVKGVF